MLTFLVSWFGLSCVVALFMGRFMRFGLGSDPQCEKNEVPHSDLRPLERWLVESTISES